MRGRYGRCYLLPTVLRSLCVAFTLMAYLAFPLQLRSEPLKVAVPPLHTRLLQLKDGEVGLWTRAHNK